MTTPTFSPSNSAFNSIRYYTQFDPYYYTVDNRPIQDIANNVGIITNGADAARRLALFNALSDDLEAQADNSTATNFLVGLSPSAPGSLQIKIDVGEVLVPTQLSATISQVILKKAILQQPWTTSFNAPGSAGQSVVYTIEGQYVDINASAPGGTYFLDTTNALMFDSCLNGVLRLQINATGSAASTGTETAPTTTSGWFPIYNLHVSYGATTWYKIYLHPNAPKITRRRGLYKDLTLRLPNASPATVSTTYDPVNSYQFADATDTQVVSTLNLDAEYNVVNPYKDLHFDIYYTTSTNTGNVALQLGYVGVTNTTLSGLTFSTTYSGTTFETVASAGTAGYLVKATLTGAVPTTVLQNNRVVIIKLGRLGSSQAASDTSAGNFNLVNITSYQYY